MGYSKKNPGIVSVKKAVKSIMPQVMLTYRRKLRDKADIDAVIQGRDNSSEYTSVDVGGRVLLARTVSDFQAFEQSVAHLKFVVSTLKKVRVPYFIVPGPEPYRHRVGVNSKYRKKALKSIREACRNEMLYAVFNPVGRISKKRVKLASKNITESVNTGVVRLFEYTTSGEGDIFSDETLGCDVEFWDSVEAFTDDNVRDEALRSIGASVFDGDALRGALIAPRRNAIAGLLPKSAQIRAKVTISGDSYDTYEPFSHNHLNDHTFPIDVVYTWVDGDDEVLKKKRQKYMQEAGMENARNNSDSRYISRDELKYSLRSLHMYGSSFVRNIYIVTDGQVPKWLKQDKRLKIVDHKEVFADKKALPVFNSHAIGSQLHHIKGLSDQYIYFNDDIFLGRPVSQGLFFTPSGTVKCMHSKAQYGVGKVTKNEAAPSSAGKNVRDLLLQSHGRSIANKFVHAPLPQSKKVAYEIEEKYNAAVDATMRSKFRSTKDISFAGALHNNYALLEGKAIPTRYRAAVVDISKEDIAGKLDYILKARNFDTFCLNDTNTPPERLEEVDRLVRDFLDRYFPFASPWEG